MATLNSLVAVLENFLYRDKIEAQAIHPEPVFVLGHPRSGTTHLQNLLALDPRLAHVNTFQAGFPSGFLLLERFAWCLGWLIDSKRPMDNMALSFATPAEDEIAVNALTGGISPYGALTFMTRFRDFLNYCTFDHASSQDQQAWTAAFIFFLKKVSLATGGRPLVIKSPVHMGRLPFLTALFPRAKFIFIHRDPLTVFLSSAHMAQEYFIYCYLAQPPDDAVTQYILDQHQQLYESYFKEKERIPPGNLVEVSFSELDADPVATMQRIYRSLKWSTGSTTPLIRAYCKQLEGFKQNDYQPLPPSLRKRLELELGPVMVKLGYRQS